MSVHALQRFDERGFKASEIEAAVRTGEILREYADDRPWPSYLVLGKVEDRVIHIIVARNVSDRICIIITAYEPGEDDWNPDFRTRRD